MAHESIPVEYLRGILNYSPENGCFVWRHRPDLPLKWNRRMAGKKAGCKLPISGGYVGIRINGVRYLAHRLAWAYHFGTWPALNIDHINGNGMDNRIMNLREANQSENHQNKRRQSNNKSGFTGVSWNTLERRWRATIQIGGKQIFLGGFAEKEDAYSAYLKAKAEFHPFQPTPRL